MQASHCIESYLALSQHTQQGEGISKSAQPAVQVRIATRHAKLESEMQIGQDLGKFLVQALTSWGD